MSSRLLMDDKALIVLPKLAEKIGLNESIIIQQIHYWLLEKKNIRDGYYWTYNTYKGWTEQFPFWSESTVKRAIKRLEELNLLIIGNYNKLAIDKTKWYRVNYEELKKYEDTEIFDGRVKMDSSTGQNDPSNESKWSDGQVNLTRALPKSTSKSTTEINNDDDKATPEKSKSQIDTSALTKPAKSEIPTIQKINPFQFYQENKFGVLSSITQDKIGTWCDDLSDELVVLAMQRALENNVVTWNYVESILKNWFSKNIRTLEEVEISDAQRQANMNRKSNYQANNNPTTPPNYNYEVKPNEPTRNNESDNDPFRNVQLFK